MYFKTFLAIFMVTAQIGADFVPGFEHFATEEAVKNAPTIDLSAFGYYGGQLPRYYGFFTNNTGITYSAHHSFDRFNDIIAGRANASDSRRRSTQLAMKRSASTTAIVMDLVGTNNWLEEWDLNPSSQCKSGANAPYDGVFVYWAANVYLTFWQSDVCNEAKESFNPICQSDKFQACVFNRKRETNSFKLYSGCHHQYASDCS
jgi:hypothetical protein